MNIYEKADGRAVWTPPRADVIRVDVKNIISASGESDPDKLLDLHLSYGTRAVTIIPDRNWRSADPEQKARLLAELDKFLAACRRRKLPVLAGTELNAPGQLLCDDYTIPELAPYRSQFLAGVAAAASFTRN